LTKRILHLKCFDSRVPDRYERLELSILCLCLVTFGFSFEGVYDSLELACRVKPRLGLYYRLFLTDVNGRILDEVVDADGRRYVLATPGLKLSN
jgi:hypothetical protein